MVEPYAYGSNTTGIGSQIRKRWTELNNRYQNQGWLEHMRAISQHFEPKKSRYLKSADIQVEDWARGGQLNGQLLNDVGTWSASTLASGMMSGITSPARPWFKIALPLRKARDQSYQTRVWLYMVTKIMMEIAAQSNTYQVFSSLYEELGMFGTSVGFMEEDFEDVVALRALTIGEYRLAANKKGKINTVYRQMVMTVYQIFEQFGKENMSSNTFRKYEDKKWDEEVVVIHAVEPNPDFNPFDQSNKAKPFWSVYIERDSNKTDKPYAYNEIPDNEKTLRIGYFDYFPFIAPRWSVIGNDPYGRGCGMKGLPDMKQINHHELRYAQLIDRISNPTLQGPTSLRTQRRAFNPGEVIYTSDPSKGFKEVYAPNPQALEYIRASIGIKEQAVKKAFYADLWAQMLESDRREMTAMEVNERRSEKMILLGPTLQNVEGDMLIPYLQFVYWRGMQAGIFPDPPEEIAGHPIRIDFVSVMHQSLLSASTSAIERVVGFAGNMAAVMPGVIDTIDQDEVMYQYNEMIGGPPTILLDPRKVQQSRTEKARQMRQQQMLESAPDLASAAANLANIDVGGGQTAASMTLGNTPPGGS